MSTSVLGISAIFLLAGGHANANPLPTWFVSIDTSTHQMVSIDPTGSVHIVGSLPPSLQDRVDTDLATLNGELYAIGNHPYAQAQQLGDVGWSKLSVFHPAGSIGGSMPLFYVESLAASGPGLTFVGLTGCPYSISCSLYQVSPGAAVVGPMAPPFAIDPDGLASDGNSGLVALDAGGDGRQRWLFGTYMLQSAQTMVDSLDFGWPSLVLNDLTLVGNAYYAIGEDPIAGAAVLAEFDATTLELHDIHPLVGAMAGSLWGVEPFPLPAMTISGTCQSAMFRARNITPNGAFAVISSTALGTDAIPYGACMGATTGLASPTLIAVQAAGGSGGFATQPITLPPSACGSWVQVVDLTSCMMSQPQQIP